MTLTNSDSRSTAASPLDATATQAGLVTGDSRRACHVDQRSRTSLRLRERWLWAIVAATLAIVVGLWRYLALAGYTNDHYMHLAAAQQMTFGEWPTRDFVDHGMPLMIALSALVLRLLPQTPLFGEALLVGTMFGLAAIVTLYAARRLTGSFWLALLAVAIEIAIFPRSYSYPKILAYAVGFAAMWRYVERPSTARLLQMSVVVVLAFLFRYDHGIYLGVGGLLTALLGTADKTPRGVARAAATYAALTLAVLLPYLIYVELYDGLWNHIARGIALEAFENARGRSIPSFGLNLDFRANAVAWLYFLFHALPLAVAVVMYVRWRHSQNRRELAIVVPLIAVAVLANFGLIRETVSARLPDVVVPACLLLIWLMARARSMRPSAVRATAWGAAAILIIVTTASVTIVGSVKERLARAEVLDGLPRLQRQFHERSAQLKERLSLAQIPSRTAYALLPFFAYADRCLTPDDRIFVPDFVPEAYVWARQPFAGGQSWFQSGVMATTHDRRLLMQRLTTQRVPISVLLPTAEPIVAEFPDLTEYVRSHFTEHVELSHDGTSIRLGFDPTIAVSRDPETGWHCYR